MTFLYTEFVVVEVLEVKGQANVIYFHMNKCGSFFELMHATYCYSIERLAVTTLTAGFLYIVTFHIAILGMFWKEFQMPYISFLCPSFTGNITPNIIPT
jgi:hypothetical protein